MADEPLTPRALVAELKEIYGASSQEDLARKIDQPLRNVQRWLTDDGLSWPNAIELLTLAGRLRDGEESRTAARQLRVQRSLDQIADQIAVLSELLSAFAVPEDS